MLERLKSVLGEARQDVRVTTRLVDSPACLVVEEGDMSAHLARSVEAGRPVGTGLLPILEVNPEHVLVKRLETDTPPDDLAQVLFDQAVLAEWRPPGRPPPPMCAPCERAADRLMLTVESRH